jgi:UPF0755 protein
MDKLRPFLVSLLILGGVFLLYPLSIFVPIRHSATVTLVVNKGESFGVTTTKLSDLGLIRSGLAIRILGRLAGIEEEIKSGEYGFRGDVSPYRVIRDLVEGRVVLYEVTIPEGYNLWGIARRMESAGIIKEEEFLEAAFDRTLLDELGIGAPSAEGYLFPDTYRFPKHASARDLIREMVRNLRMHYDDKMRRRAEELGMSEREVLTLASIIEKETGNRDERPLISAVFHNRLRRGMPLQADPTSVYGVKDQSEGITRDDLQRESPYNTYRIRGLPPGPIASPGLDSIRAALYPADVDYLYFVSKHNGRHHFSKTREEHLRAVRLYRKQGR